MVRTQIQLTEEQARDLKVLASQQGMSRSELIRRFLDTMLAVAPATSDADVRKRAIAAAGRIHSGTGDLSARHDDYLTEAFGD